MLGGLELNGNPSSVHAEGRAARAAVETAREQVAALVGADPSEVVLTSGATEANAIVLAGKPWASIVSSGMEHPSVAEAAGTRPGLLIAAQPDGRAAIDDELAPMLAASTVDASGERWELPAPLLVSHHLANGETGVVHDVTWLAAICRAVRPDAVVHTDATQAVGRIPVDLAGLGVDALTISSHKLGGPKGVGALIVRDHISLAPLMLGGGQERRLRPGTENIAAIAGFGAAAEAVQRQLQSEARRMAALRDHLEAAVQEMTPAAVIVGRDAPRLPNTSCISLPGRTSEMLVIALDLAGIAVSAGSACSSGKVAESPTLVAMGLDRATRRGAIRLSLGWSTSETDVAAFLAAWKSIAVTHRAAA
ncbi:MAG: cysteine desulfurase family protein [Hyphomicrobiaceae bacterium]